jgi:hypothetical protein
MHGFAGYWCTFEKCIVPFLTPLGVIKLMVSVSRKHEQLIEKAICVLGRITQICQLPPFNATDVYMLDYKTFITVILLFGVSKLAFTAGAYGAGCVKSLLKGRNAEVTHNVLHSK